MRFPLNGGQYWVYVIECFHTVSNVGYIIAEQRHKLKDEFKGLNQQDLIKLKNEGLEIMEQIEIPLLAYLCDTNANIFREEGIFQCSVIMIECTFLEDSMKFEANERGHLVWSDRREHVEAHPNILFILFHFSQRYKDEDIQKFFKTASSNQTRPPNVLLWLYSGIDLNYN
jgi:ribonuclease Z